MSENAPKKLEVFIGATRHDLSEVRKLLIEAVLDAGHIPSGMELWSAGSQPLQDDILKRLERCDVHIIIIGARYGHTIKGRDLSFTEWEYDQSINKRPILGFLLHDDEFKKQRSQIELEDKDESDKIERLRSFRKRLRESRFCKDFRMASRYDLSEVSRLCINSITELINSGELNSDAGWIKASTDEAKTLIGIRENKFLKSRIEKLRSFSVLADRVQINENSKAVAADGFWELMEGQLQRSGFHRLFLEAGSTLAYVAESFEKKVLRNSQIAEKWQIQTNNVMALLQLMLDTDVEVHRYPAAAPDPEDKYGAIFPAQFLGTRERPPKNPRKLYEHESTSIQIVRNEIRELGEGTILLATTSGWDLDHDIEDFRGPHVGSHPNMLFKRALFTTGHPVVIFINAEKLGAKFIVGRCFPIFSLDFSLEQAIGSLPISICVGYDRSLSSKTNREISEKSRKTRNEPDYIKETLSRIGFADFIHDEDSEGIAGVVIASNETFLGGMND